MKLLDSPMLMLLARRRARRCHTPAAYWVGLGLVPVGLTGWLPISPLTSLLMMLAVNLIYPLYLAGHGAMALASLRRGRCFDELLGSRTTARELIDSVALDTAMVFARTGFWLLGPWAGWFWLQGQSPAWAVPAWLGQLGMAVLLSYLAQAGQSWSDGDADFVIRQAVVGVGLAPVVLGGSLLLGPEPNAPGLAGLALAVGLVCRALAVRGLEAYPRLRGKIRQARDLFASRTPGWGDIYELGMAQNPVVFRERRAEARYAPLGRFGLLLGRHGFAALLLAAVAGTAYRALEAHWANLQGVLWMTVVVFFVVQTLRAAYRTVGSLVDERESGTLESLLQTTLSGRDWIAGWVMVGFAPRAIENLVAGLLWVGVAWLGGQSPLRFGLCLILLMGFTLAATYAGICASAVSSSREQALDRVGVDLSAGLWLLGMVALLVALWAPGPLALVGLALGAGILVRYQRAALGLLLETPVHDQDESWVEEVLRSGLQRSVPDGFGNRLHSRLGEEPAAEVLTHSLRQGVPDGFKSRLLERLSREGLTEE
ncbi:MAG: hypothetical protein AB7S38_25170 [Vulcanimicrobiota bacterium]